MDIDEIRQYIVSRDICVDIRLLDRYPGWVRTIRFLPANRVEVRFVGYDVDDGEGYRYAADYDSLEAAINIIEAYLQQPIEQWRNYTKTADYPPRLFDEEAAIEGSIQILKDVTHRRLPLPDNQRFRMLSARITKKVYEKWLGHLNEMKQAKRSRHR